MYIFNITLLFYFFIYVNFSFYMEFIHFLLKELLKHSFGANLLALSGFISLCLKMSTLPSFPKVVLIVI